MIIRPNKSDLIQKHQITQQIENDNPCKGKPIFIHSPSFKVSLDEVIKAMDGPPAWVRRLKRIDDWMDNTLEKAFADWIELASENRTDEDAFRQAWIFYAKNIEFSHVNKWICAHNEYFPTEAKLPYDVRTGKIFCAGKPFAKKDPLGPDWVLTQYPPDLTQALSGASRSRLNTLADLD